jgi:hypothetical protein
MLKLPTRQRKTRWTTEKMMGGWFLRENTLITAYLEVDND